MNRKPTYEKLEKAESERLSAEAAIKQTEEGLRASESSYWSVFMNAGTATIIIEEDMVISMANPKFEQLSGYKRKEVEGLMKWPEFVVPEDLEKMKQYHRKRRQKEGKPPTEYQFRFIARDGSIKYVNNNVGLIPGTKRSVASLADITMQKQAEEILKESEQKYRAIFESAHDAIFIMKDDSFVDCNGKTLKLFGCSRDEIVGKSPYEFSPEKQPDGRDSREKALEKITAAFEGEPQSFEWVHTTKDGKPFHTEVSLNRYETKDDKFLMAIVRDISFRKRAEEEVERSRQDFRNTLESLKEIVVQIDRDFVIKVANRTISELYGIPHDQLVGKRCYEVIYGRETPCPDCTVQEAMQTKKITSIPRYRPDGLILDRTAYPILDADGQVKGATILALDITSRKQAEEALNIERIRLKSLFEYSGEAIVLLDMENHILDVNPGFEHIFGYAPEEAEGKVMEDLICPERFYHTEAKELDEQALRGIKGVEIIRRRKDGEEIDVRVSAGPIKIQDKITGRFVVFDDISHRKQAEEALRQSKESLKAILEASPDPVVVYDLEGYPSYLNPAFTQVFKWSLNELKEKHVPFVPEDQREITSSKIRDLYEQSHPVTVETKRFTKEGKLLDVIVSAALIKGNEEEAKGMVVNLTDITERNRLASQFQAAQRMESIGILAGGIAHNFNNILMGIQGHNSLVMMKKDPSHPDYGHLNGIEESVSRATELTKALLGFARGGKYEVKPTDLNHLIKGENLIFGQTKKEIQIHGNYEENLWAVEADQGQIQQVLLNLYVNAWQAMPEGGHLYIQTKNITLDETYVKPFKITPGRYVQVSVTDTGSGMDDATRERLFDPFFSTKEMGQGTGLGLASVYGIIKNHGGLINVYSEKGKGATFNIYLPVSEKEVIERHREPGKAVKGNETVLLVDDEEMILDVGQEMLERLGYQVLIAGSGKEALDVYGKQSKEIDLVILDMIMPDMSGGKTYDGMKEIDKGGSVLLSSGYSLNGQAKEILDRGCNGFIQKPFSLNDLSAKIRKALGKTR